MGLFLSLLLFITGLVLIVRGGDWFLNGAVWIAEATGVPRFIIGASVVSLATTLPELAVSVTGVLHGKPDLAVGNAVGSVSVNLGLILGISALCLPPVVSHRQFDRKALLMALGAASLLLLGRTGSLSAPFSLLLFAVPAVYFALLFRDARESRQEERRIRPERRTSSYRKMRVKLTFFALGIGGIVIGSRLLILYGSRLALLMGIPESVVGVTMVAVGTSLPELVTTVTAIVKKEASLSVGNLIGANIIDLTMILPLCAAVSGGSLAIGHQSIVLDLPVCLLFCLVGVIPPLWKGRFYRWQGVALLVMYALYMGALALL